MRTLLAGTVAIAALVGLTMPASAGPMITANLDQISSSKIGSGTLGTVTLTQNGDNEVDVAVTLLSSSKFVSTGGPHHAFAFNIDLLTTYSTAITSPPGIFEVGGSGKNTPYGTFTDVIDCPGCGPGASHANPGPLKFTVTDTSGISTTDFMLNTSGYYFSADVIGPAGGTGNIAADKITSTPVPVAEPASMALLGAGLLGLGLVRRKRRDPERPA